MTSSIKRIPPILSSSSTHYLNSIQKSKPKKSSPLTTELIFNENQLPINHNHNPTSTIKSNLQISFTLFLDGIIFIFLSFILLPQIINLNTILSLNQESLSRCLPFCSQHLYITSTLISYTHHLTLKPYLQFIIFGFLLTFKLIFGLITLTSSSISSSTYLLRTIGAYLTLTAVSGIHSQTSQINPSLYATLASLTSATILLVGGIIGLIVLICSPILWFIHQIIEEEDRSSIDHATTTSCSSIKTQSSLSGSHLHHHHLPNQWYSGRPASAISAQKRALIGPGF